MWFEVPDDAAPREAASDAFALIALLAAMRLGRGLAFAAPLSAGLRANLDELVAIYSMWFPQFTAIEIDADVVDAPPGGTGRALFFSGGVDSFHTLVTRRHRFDRLIYVGGLDTGVGDHGLLDAIRASVRSAAVAADLPLVEVQTNAKSVLEPYADWTRHSHSLVLAAVGHAMSGTLGHCTFSSDRTYRDLMPYGTHPVTAPLFGSDRLQVESVGWGVTRVDKVAAIAGSDVAMDHLRVCWENLDGAFNCGRCDKCIRTKIDLALAGALERCATFDDDLDPARIAATDAIPPGTRHYLMPSLERARQIGRDEIAAGLDEAMGRALAADAAARIGGDFDLLARRDAAAPFVAEHRDALYRHLSAHHGRWLVTQVLRSIPGRIAGAGRRARWR